MAETRVINPHGTRRRLRKHASTVIRVVPLGVVLPMIFFLGSVGPDDFARNYAGWARKWGLTDWAEWLAQYATGPRVFWTVVLFSGVYLAIVFGLPALIERTKKNVAAVIVPVSVTAILIIILYAWSLITPRSPPQWNITPEQDDELKVALSEAANKYNVVISVVPAAPTDAMDAGYHLMQIIRGLTWMACNGRAD